MTLAALILGTVGHAAMLQCEIDGVPTFTDRAEICDQQPSLELERVPLSIVDPWTVPLPELPDPVESTDRQPVQIQRQTIFPPADESQLAPRYPGSYPLPLSAFGAPPRPLHSPRPGHRATRSADPANRPTSRSQLPRQRPRTGGRRGRR